MTRAVSISPGVRGGLDVLDQDGNNGCGNDDDFEDDNEGWCGKPPIPAIVTPPPSTPPPNGGGGGGVSPRVLGEIQTEKSSAEVLGELEDARVPGAVGAAGPAFTGTEALTLAGVVLALAPAGVILVWMGRRRAAQGS